MNQHLNTRRNGVGVRDHTVSFMDSGLCKPSIVLTGAAVPSVMTMFKIFYHNILTKSYSHSPTHSDTFVNNITDKYGKPWDTCVALQVSGTNQRTA